MDDSSQEALQKKLAETKKKHLATECAKIEPFKEKELAESGIAIMLEVWSDY